MLVILEGIDKVGKTALSKKLEDVGFLNFKDEPFDGIENLTKERANEKLTTTLSFLKMLDKKGIDIVVDRFHFSELIYGKLDRGYENWYIHFLDEELNKLNTHLVLIQPTNINYNNEKHGSDLSKHNNWFKHLFEKTAIKNKTTLDHKTIDELNGRRLLGIIKANHISDFALEMNSLYFASPFFTEEQIEREESLIKILRNEGFKVFSPKENILLTPNANDEERRKCFEDNIKEINDNNFVFAITNGKDMGTIWECGYAYGKNKKIVYFAENLEGNFNIMLAQSGCGVITKRQEVTKQNITDCLLKNKKYDGGIE